MDVLSKIPVGVYYGLFILVGFIITVFATLYIISVYKHVRLKFKDVSLETPQETVAQPIVTSTGVAK